MEHSHDHESYIAALDTGLPVLIARGMAPSAVKNLFGVLPILSTSVRRGFEASSHLIDAARECVGARISAQQQGTSEKPRNDILDRLLDIMKEQGETLDFQRGEVEYESFNAM